MKTSIPQGNSVDTGTIGVIGFGVENKTELLEFEVESSSVCDDCLPEFCSNTQSNIERHRLEERARISM